MTIDRDTLIFFDASCLIAAAGSQVGGSSFLLSVCERGFLRGAVSQPVLLEAERNIILKLGVVALRRYHHLLVATPLVLAPVPTEKVRRRYRQAVGAKDDHVAAAARAVHAPFLITLDKPLAQRVNHADVHLTALSPGEFITTILPSHIEYPSLRT